MFLSLTNLTGGILYRGNSTGTTVYNQAGLRVVQIPILEDNYSYLLIDNASKTAAAVDPAEPNTIIEQSKQENVIIRSILTTHHHWDHAGGNEELLQQLGEMDVYGADERIPKLNQFVTEKSLIRFGASTNIQVLLTPCHTS